MLPEFGPIERLGPRHTEHGVKGDLYRELPHFIETQETDGVGKVVYLAHPRVITQVGRTQDLGMDSRVSANHLDYLVGVPSS